MRTLRFLSPSLLVLAACSPSSANIVRQDEADNEGVLTGLEVIHTGGPEGCERPTQQGDTIAVNYRGTLNSTGALFDESYSRGEPIEFVLGIGRVIAGWDEGLVGMCVGESRKLIIPSNLAYGEMGSGSVIPPGATLVFETHLEDIVRTAPGSAPLPTAAPASTSTSEAVATSTNEGTFSIATAPSEPQNMDPTDFLVDDNGDKIIDEETWRESVADEVIPDDELGEIDGIDLPGESESFPIQSSSSEPELSEAEADQAECKLLGPFALFVQGALGALALLTLVWKRWREQPKRPWKIFFFDVSKQVLGSFLTHIINLAMSMVGSIDVQNAAAHAVSQGGAAYQDAAGRTPNPCSYYLLNLGIDTTIGVPILYVLLKVLYGLFLYTPLARPPLSIKSGNYGSPPKVTWYLKQLFIYCIGLIGMKLFVFFLFMALPWLPWVGDWALRWTNGNEALEITFALFIFPLIMNAIQYWVIDNFIMDRKSDEQGYQQVSEDDDEARQRMLSDDDVTAAQSFRSKGADDSDDNSLDGAKFGSGSQSRGTGGGSRTPRSDHSKLA